MFRHFSSSPSAISGPLLLLDEQQVSLLKKLNRQARRVAVLLMIQIARQSLESSPEEEETSRRGKCTTRKDEFFLKDFLSDFYLLSPLPIAGSQFQSQIDSERKEAIEQTAHQQANRCQVLISLCHKFISPDHLEIPSGILQLIIKFL
jgi:hypothetical protein